MGKGNLYTHLIRHNDKRIKILFQLKQAWRTNPRNYKLIDELQKQLKLVSTKKPKRGKLYKSIFNGYYYK